MSKLTFLGTGAADWDINNKTAEFRRFSSALVDDNLLIDPGPHIFDFASDFKDAYFFDNVTDVIVTHSHRDHFCPETVKKLAEKQKIRLGCDIHVQKILGEINNVECVIFEPYKKTVIGNYEITPMWANHHMDDLSEVAFHYIIKCGEKKVFYGCDGAWFLRPTWHEMKKHRFDVMVLECTVGDSHDWRIFEHNTIPMLRMIKEEIDVQKLVKEGGKVFASHMARTLHESHAKTSEILEEIGVIAAYDGLEIEF